MFFIHAVGVFKQIKCQQENYYTNIQPYVSHKVWVSNIQVRFYYGTITSIVDGK